MLASNKSKSEMIKDIRKIEQNLSRRVANIEKREDLPQFGAESFRKYQQRVKNKLGGKKSLTSLTEEQVRTIHRDVRYLNTLKSTSIKGAEQARDMYLPVKQKLETLSPDLRKKFWSIYEKVVERFGYMDMFKYELFESNIDYIYGGESDTDKAVAEIFELYDKTLKELGGNVTDEEIKVLFTSKLQSLRK